MRRFEAVYYHTFFEIVYNDDAAGAGNKGEIKTYDLNTRLASLGASMPAYLTSLRTWAASRQLVTADNSLLDSMIALLQTDNPYIWVSASETPSEEEAIIVAARFWNWARKTENVYKKRFELLDKTATQLLADVQSSVTMEREEDDDSGQDVTADSDMPITSTFSAVLANPTTTADKMSILRVANRDYSHKWKDVTTSKNPMMTLAARIEECLRLWEDMVTEWEVEAVNTFSLTPDPELEDYCDE